LTKALTESAVNFGISATTNDNASIPLTSSGKAPSIHPEISAFKAVIACRCLPAPTI
jgi:hypothetical protein